MERESNQTEAERRLVSRLAINIRFKYVVISPSADIKEIRNATTKNISASGLVFECEEKIPIDAKLKMTLYLTADSTKTLEVEGEVARVEKLSTAEKYDIGVNFINVSDEQKEEIRRRVESMDMLKLLDSINNKEISDLHLTANSPPMARISGKLVALSNEPLSGEEIRQMIFSILSEEQRRYFDKEKDLDFAFSPRADARYRVSIYQQRGKTEVVFRNIMSNIKSRHELGLPDVMEELCQLREGLIIIGGTTGSGKTTTITSMIDIINRNRAGVILSLEKPIEYLHKNMKGVVKQREVGIDVPSFASGLKAALRQDPDVIVVGEVLDSDTIETAFEATETGHLVITSLHATDTVQVFDRVISFFPLDQRDFIYSRLSHSLKAIIIQKLLPHRDGTGRVIATEICMVNTPVRRIIHSGDFTQLPSVIQTGSQYKMHLMPDSIEQLYQKGLISQETYEIYGKGENLRHYVQSQTK